MICEKMKPHLGFIIKVFSTDRMFSSGQQALSAHIWIRDAPNGGFVYGFSSVNQQQKTVLGKSLFIHIETAPEITAAVASVYHWTQDEPDYKTECQEKRVSMCVLISHELKLVAVYHSIQLKNVLLYIRKQLSRFILFLFFR